MRVRWNPIRVTRPAPTWVPPRPSLAPPRIAFTAGVSGPAQTGRRRHTFCPLTIKTKLLRRWIMATQKQRAAARKNIKKAQAAWQSMSHRQHALAQPEGRKRQKPGTGGGGEFYRITVRPK